jgi:hypothetical protein
MRSINPYKFWRSLPATPDRVILPTLSHCLSPTGEAQ